MVSSGRAVRLDYPTALEDGPRLLWCGKELGEPEEVTSPP